jgi:hypothetical protein
MRFIHLRLTRKPSGKIHGLDLSRSQVGDIVVVTPYSAMRLIADGCAVEVQPSQFLASRVIYPPSRVVAS